MLKNYFHHYIQSQIYTQEWPKQSLILPPQQAHRGVWGHRRQDPIENTLEAFQLAIDKYHFKMCECDVRLTKDGIPVVHHDRDLKRLWMLDGNISDWYWSDLKLKTKIPTLSQVLNLSCLWNIELKTSHFLNESLERKVAQTVLNLGKENKVLFSSFNPLSLWKIQGFLPHSPRALLITKESMNNPNKYSLYLKSLALAPWLSFHILHLRWEDVTEKELIFWMKRKVPVALWTIGNSNDMEKAKKFLKEGLCQSIIVDVVQEPSEI